MTVWGHYRVNLRRKKRENGKVIGIENVELHKDTPSWGRGWHKSVKSGYASVFISKCFRSDEDCLEYQRQNHVPPGLDSITR